MMTTQNALYAELTAARQTYHALDAIDTFDFALDHADYRRKMNAHITYLRLQAEYIGTPGSAESVIAYLYGKKHAQPVIEAIPATANTTRVVYTETGYDMEDSSETTFDADDFLGPVTRTPVAETVAAPQMERKLIMGRDGYPVGILDTDTPATPAPVSAIVDTPAPIVQPDPWLERMREREHFWAVKAANQFLRRDEKGA